MIDCEKSAIFDAITKVKGSLLKISPGFERVRAYCFEFGRTRAMFHRIIRAAGKLLER
jgi:hypothetical protein